MRGKRVRPGVAQSLPQSRVESYGGRLTTGASRRAGTCQRKGPTGPMTSRTRDRGTGRRKKQTLPIPPESPASPSASSAMWPGANVLRGLAGDAVPELPGHLLSHPGGIARERRSRFRIRFREPGDLVTVKANDLAGAVNGFEQRLKDQRLQQEDRQRIEAELKAFRAKVCNGVTIKPVTYRNPQSPEDEAGAEVFLEGTSEPLGGSPTSICLSLPANSRECWSRAARTRSRSSARCLNKAPRVDTNHHQNMRSRIQCFRGAGSREEVSRTSSVRSLHRVRSNS